MISGSQMSDLRTLAGAYAAALDGSDTYRWQAAQAAYDIHCLPETLRETGRRMALEMSRQGDDASSYYNHRDAWRTWLELSGVGLVTDGLRQIAPFSAWHTVYPLIAAEEHEFAAQMLANYETEPGWSIRRIRTAMAEHAADPSRFGAQLQRAARMLARLWQDSEFAGLDDAKRRRLRRLARLVEGMVE